MQYQEGQRLRGPNGEDGIFQNGHIVVLSPAPVITRPADPRLPYQVRREAAGAVSDTNRADASRYDAQIAEAHAREAAANATIAQSNAAAGRQTSQAAQQLSGRRANVNAASNQLLDVARRYHGGFEGGDFLQRLRESLPDFMSPINAQFDAAAAGLSESSLAALRVPGVGSQSDTELRQFLRSNQPDAQAFDTTTEQRLDNVQNRLNAHRQELGLPRIDWRAATREQIDLPPSPPSPPAPAPGAPPSPPAAPNIVPQTTLGNGGTDIMRDPAMRGIAARVSTMLAGDSSDQEVLDYLRSAGVDPQTTNVGTALRARRTDNFRRWHQLHPRAGYPVGERFFTSEVARQPVRTPVDALNRSFSDTANTGVGNYFIQSGQALTGNHIDNLVGAMGGNEEQAQAAIDQMRREHPISSLAGDLTGTAMLYGAGDGAIALGGRMLGGGALAASRGGQLASRFFNPTRGVSTFAPRSIAGDALYGGYEGSGQGEGGASEILGGASAGVGGGMFGRFAPRAAGHTLRGVTNLDVRALTGADVPLTIGQMLRPSNSIPARFISSTEDRLAGLPLTGDIIGASRYRGQEGFNRAAFNRGVRGIPGDITATGASGVGQGQRLTADAYRGALDGVNLSADAPFKADMAAARAAGIRLPLHGDVFASTLDNEVGPLFDASGNLTGPNFQAARQILRGERAHATGPGSDPARNAYTRAEGALTDMVDRQSPGTMPALTAADRSYKNMSILGDAVGSARSRPDELFTAAQLGTADFNNTVKFGGRNAARAGRTPFYALRSAGSNVLGNVIPDSGTAGRAMLYGLGGLALGGTGAGGALGFNEGGDAQSAASGAGTGLEGALGLGALLAAPHSKAGQRFLQNLLVKRPRVLREAGDAILEGLHGAAPRAGGMFGAGAGTYYAGQ